MHLNAECLLLFQINVTLEENMRSYWRVCLTQTGVSPVSEGLVSYWPADTEARQKYDTAPVWTCGGSDMS